MRRLLVILSVLMGLPVVASAQQRAYLAQVRQDLDGDGKPEQLRILPTGALEIRSSLKRLAHVVATVRLGHPKPRVGSIDVIDGSRFGLRKLVIARIRDSKNARSPGFARVLGWDTKGHQMLWSGDIGYQGSDREWSRRLAVTRRGLELYDERPELTTCAGNAPIPLYARAFDFKNKKFRPYRIKNALPAGSTALTTTTTAPQGAPAQPRAAFMRATGATSRRGASSAADLAAPRAIDDGDPATAWIEGRGGPGVGEQILFRQGEPAEPIAAVGILPGHGASAEEFKNRGRVARFGLIVSDGKGTQSFEIKIPRDPVRLGKDAHRTLHWALLPKPIAARCAQLVLLSSYRGAQAEGRRDDIAIAEVHLLSAAELSGQLDPALAKRVSVGGSRGEQAARALRDRGAPAARALLAELEKSKDPAAQRRLFAALLPIDDPAVAPALARAATSPSTPAQSRELFVDRLSKMDEAGARALAGLVGDAKAPESVQLAAVGALMRNRSDAVLELALELAGSGSRPVRRALSLAMAKRFEPARLLEAASAKSQAAGAEADLARAAGTAAASKDRSVQDAIASALGKRLAEVGDYERRYRIVQTLAGLGTGEALRSWWQSATSQDAHTVALRRVAVAGARRNPSAAWLRALALADGDPGVRMAAAETVSKDELAAVDGKLIALLGSDPWPAVRIGAAAGLAQACAVAARTNALVSAAKADDDVGVQRRAMKGLIDCAPGAAKPVLFAVARGEKQKAAARVFAVTQLGVYGDPADVPGLIDVLEVSRRRAFDSETEQQVAATAITALGRLRDPRAVKAILASSQDEAYPQIQAAAAAALASFCSPAVTKRLQSMAVSPQRTVSLAAKRSLASCRRR